MNGVSINNSVARTNFYTVPAQDKTNFNQPQENIQREENFCHGVPENVSKLFQSAN